MTETDEELMRFIASGKKAALEALYDRYERLVYSLAFQAVHDQFAAEEIVQDVFTRIWRKREVYDGTQSAPRTWVLTLTRRIAIDYIRKRGRLSRSVTGVDEYLQALPDGESTAPEEAAELSEVQRLVVAAISELPSDQKLLIERMYFQGFTQHELAESLDIPLGTVKSRIRLGLNKLRRKLSAVQMEEMS